MQYDIRGTTGTGGFLYWVLNVYEPTLASNEVVGWLHRTRVEPKHRKDTFLTEPWGSGRELLIRASRFIWIGGLERVSRDWDLNSCEYLVRHDFFLVRYMECRD